MAAFFEGCRVQSCCGYWSIRTGTLIIGIIFMISTILALSKYIVTMIIIETHWQFCQQKANKDDSDELAENQEFPVPGLENLTLMKCKDFHRIVSYRLLFYVGIMMYTVQLILTSLMIHGAKNGKPKMMSPWLLWTLMYISYGILNMVFSSYVKSARSLWCQSSLLLAPTKKCTSFFQVCLCITKTTRHHLIHPLFLTPTHLRTRRIRTTELWPVPLRPVLLLLKFSPHRHHPQLAVNYMEQQEVFPALVSPSLLCQSLLFPQLR
ncbi:uncharacterized protein LOC143020281 isoform X2 [Oratosquilla oratoria]|uniref:uncharacterized protein LOC143020281 isoform X2 n=1 Tax=Oratosquilla oratoria TaxID=337810 RepID=UPI003F76A64D